MEINREYYIKFFKEISDEAIEYLEGKIHTYKDIPENDIINELVTWARIKLNKNVFKAIRGNFEMYGKVDLNKDIVKKKLIALRFAGSQFDSRVELIRERQRRKPDPNKEEQIKLTIADRLSSLKNILKKNGDKNGT